MNKRLTGRLACLLLLLLASNALGAEKPNILFIFADDWGWGDLSCRDHPYVLTPHIDRLAEEGTDYQRFTVASGVCSPSRTAVMTGHFPARYNVDGHFATVRSNANRGMPDWVDPASPLLPRMLQEAGYRTAHYGKWHLSNNMIPDSPTPAEYGYDDYGAFNCSGEQMPWYKDSERASAFMVQSAEEGKPFFINVWLHEPHTPFHTVPMYEWRFRHLPRQDQIYASVLSHADDRIGQLLATLDELGIADNTLVIFSSDNGPAGPARQREMELELKYDTATGAGWGLGAARGLTGGRQGRKGSLYEGGVGVPFIVRWPGKVAAGQVDDASLISAVDLLPTFCQIAGADLPQGYTPDGVSMIPVLEGTPRPSRDKPLFWKTTGGSAWSVVHGRWKLHANRDLSQIELYNIAQDVAEAANLAGQEPDVAAAMLEMLKAWQATLPDKPSGNVFSQERAGRGGGAGE